MSLGVHALPAQAAAPRSIEQQLQEIQKKIDALQKAIEGLQKGPRTEDKSGALTESSDTIAA